MILEIIVSKIAFFNIGFCVSSINVVIIIIISLTRLNFHDLTFLIIKNTLIKVVKKASFYFYSNNVSSFALLGKRINIIVTL